MTSVVWAEMKKHVTYNVDACLNSSGVVLEAQCERGTGQGLTAHCNHVVVLLYGICHFLVDGKMLTEQICTQVIKFDSYNHFQELEFNNKLITYSSNYKVTAI